MGVKDLVMVVVVITTMVMNWVKMNGLHSEVKVRSSCSAHPPRSTSHSE